jgi:hypothetical protein
MCICPEKQYYNRRRKPCKETIMIITAKVSAVGFQVYASIPGRPPLLEYPFDVFAADDDGSSTVPPCSMRASLLANGPDAASAGRGAGGCPLEAEGEPDPSCFVASTGGSVSSLHGDCGPASVSAIPARHFPLEADFGSASAVVSGAPGGGCGC